MMLIGSVTFLMSCGDDDSEPSEADFLQQNWILDSYTYVNLPAEVSYWGESEFTDVYDENKFSLSFSGSNFTRGVRYGLVAGGDTTFTESGEYTFSENELLLDPTGKDLGAILSVVFGVTVDPLPNVFVVETITSSNLIISTEQNDNLTSNDWQDYVNENFNSSVEVNAYLDSLSEDQYDSLIQAVLIPVTFDIVYDFDLDLE